MKHARRKKMAAALGCMLLYSSWQPAVFAAGETDDAVIVEEVSVTDTRLRERLAIKKTEITAETIKEQGAETAAQVLEKQAGVTISTNNAEGKAAVSIRGSDANNTKVFVDGVPLSPVGDGTVDLSSIPAGSIEKIEVFKGAAPVQYGSDAAGGVIYITTKKGGKQEASVSTSIGSWNTLRQALSLSGSQQKATYFFDFKQETSDGYTENTAKTAKYYDGKVGIPLTANSSLSLFGSYAQKHEQLPDRYDENGMLITNPGTVGQVTGNTGGHIRGTSFWYQTAHVRLDPVTNWHGGLVYNHQFSGSSLLKFTLYKSAESKYMTADRLDHLTGGQDAAGTVRGYQLEHTVSTSPVNTVLWGYNRELRDFDQYTRWDQWFDSPYSYFTRAKYRYDSQGYFFQDTLKLNKLTASLGYRHNLVRSALDWSSLDYNDANKQSEYMENPTYSSSRTFKDPVFGFNYALTDRTELHGSIGKSFRYPTPAESAGFATIGTSAQAGARVRPEEMINRELGVAYSAPGGVHLDVTGFYKTLTDKIKSRTVVGQTTYVNVPGQVTMKGFEAEFSKKFGDRVKAVAQYTYTSAKDPEAGRQINDQPEHKAALSVNYTGGRGLKAYLSLNYLGSRFSDFSNGSGNNKYDPKAPPEFNAVNLPAYASVDFMLTKSLKNREYYVKFNNMLDKQYYAGAYLLAPGRYVEYGVNLKL